jgi:hypothetical protein
MEISFDLDTSIGSGQPVTPWFKHAPTIITVGMVVIHWRCTDALRSRCITTNSPTSRPPLASTTHADVFSNAGFALVAIWGWLTLRPWRASDQLRAGWPGYRLFLIGPFLTAFGSGFYHLAPDNARLMSDRRRSPWLAPACSSASAETPSPD